MKFCTILVISHFIFQHALAQTFCPSRKYSASFDSSVDLGMYQRVHPDGEYMLTSSNYSGHIIDLTDFKNPKIRKTAAKDELYPVEGSWKLVASPNHEDGMRYFLFDDANVGLLQKGEDAKAVFNDKTHNEFYHSSAELKKSNEEIRFRTLLWSQMRARDYTVKLGKNGQIKNVSKGKTYTLCTNLIDRVLQKKKRELAQRFAHIIAKKDQLNEDSEVAYSRWEEARRQGDVEQIKIAKAIVDHIELKIDAFNAQDTPEMKAFKANEMYLYQSEHLENPILSKDGTEVGGVWQGTTRVFKVNKDGTCKQTVDLGFQASKINFSYPENGKARFITFTGSGEVSKSGKRPPGFLQTNAYILDRESGEVQMLNDDPNQVVVGYPGFTRDGQVLFAAQEKVSGPKRIVKVDPYSKNCPQNKISDQVEGQN